MAKSSKQNESMPNGHLHDLFVDELKDIYSAEKQLTKGLKKMAEKASNEKLKQAFEKHLEQTENQIERLKKAFESIDLTPRAKKCKAMEGLIKEAEEIMDEFEDEKVLDAALIAAAQKVEHYEMASYGCLVTYAKLMGHTEAAQLLQETLDEEGETDKLLTKIAMSGVNKES